MWIDCRLLHQVHGSLEDIYECGGGRKWEEPRAVDGFDLISDGEMSINFLGGNPIRNCRNAAARRFIEQIEDADSFVGECVAFY